MCNKRDSTRIKIDGKTVRVDSCMANLIVTMNKASIDTIACCCGHGRYDMSIVLDSKEGLYDLISGKMIAERKGVIYSKDKSGFFYIPEAVRGRRERIFAESISWWQFWRRL